MSRSYREAMEHLEVTPAMRERILKNLAQAEVKPKKTVRFVPWKQAVSLAACAAILVVGITALPRGNELGGASSASEELVGTTAAPTQQFDTLEALSAAAGFAVQEPQGLPFAVQDTHYTLLFGELAQVEQTGTEGERVLYRVSQEAGDNSGDYNVYTVEQQVSWNAADVTLKGNADGFHLAVWQADGSSYSLNSSVGVTLERMQKMLESVQ